MEKRTTQKALKCMRTFYQDNPFLELLEIKLVEAEYGRVRLAVDIRNKHTNVYGIAHGGVSMTLADTAAGAACLSCNKRVVTLNCTLSYIKPIENECHIYADGIVVHNGNNTMVCDSEVYNEKGELCVRLHGTFFVLKEYTEDSE